MCQNISRIRTGRWRVRLLRRIFASRSARWFPVSMVILVSLGVLPIAPHYSVNQPESKTTCFENHLSFPDENRGARHACAPVGDVYKE